MDYEEHVDPRIEPFCSILVYGQSNCGKSYLSAQVALRRDEIFTQKHSKCIIFYQYEQSLFTDVQREGTNIVLVSTREQLEAEIVPRSLIICDDYLLTAYSNENSTFITKFFLERCHHSFLTLFMQSQLLFSKTGRPWALNASHFVFFKSYNESNVARYFRNFGSESDFMLEAYKKAVEGRPYGHFFASFHARTPENLRFRSNIIPGESVEIFVKEEVNYNSKTKTKRPKND